MTTYPQGRTITIGPETLLDGDSIESDATDVVLNVTAPDGTVTTPNVSHTDTGVYEAPGIELDAPGTWDYEWVLTVGTDVTVRTDQFYVTPSPTTTDARRWALYP